MNKFRAILFALIVLAFAAYVISINVKSNSSIAKLDVAETNLDCNNDQSFKNFVSAAWIQGELKDRIDEYETSNNSSFYLRKDDKTPFLLFDGKVVVYHATGTKKDSVDEFLNLKVITKLVESGFLLDKLSTSSGEYKHQSIFTKDDQIVAVNSLDFNYSEGNENYGISIICANKDHPLLDLYSELLGTDPIKEDIASNLQYSKVVEGIRFEIWENYGNIVHTEIGGRNSSAHSVWMFRDTQGNWTSIYKGQERPDCKTLEKFKVPAGVSCLDLTNPDGLYGETS